MVLAMYDFAAKQNFIYKTNKIKEIVGASQLIKDAFGDFFGLLLENGFKLMPTAQDFAMEEFKMHGYNCAVVYEGGGNLFMVFDSKENCVKANKKFSQMIYQKTYGLNLVCAYVPVTGNFKHDQGNLYKKSREIKENTPMLHPVNVLPFTMIDRSVSLPFSVRQKINNEEKELSRESKLKLEKYHGIITNTTAEYEKYYKQSEKILDELTEDDNSLLAVIYIDGNAMGKKVENLFKDEKDVSYDFRAQRLKEFSAKINNAFQEKPFKEIEEFILKNTPESKDKTDKNILWFREIIGGGDEITIICNAHIALEIVKIYFETVQSYNYEKEENFSSCAGIAVFHSHDPFSEIYKIAEECCESGKKRNRKPEHNNENFYVDFHYCRSGITNTLENIREREEAQYTNRPYCWHGSDEKHCFKQFEDAGAALKKMKRGDVKALLDSIFEGESYFKIELERLKTKYKDFEEEYINEKNKKVIFDACLFYDLWFKEKESGNSDNSDNTEGDAENAGNKNNA